MLKAATASVRKAGLAEGEGSREVEGALGRRCRDRFCPMDENLTDDRDERVPTFSPLKVMEFLMS